MVDAQQRFVFCYRLTLKSFFLFRDASPPLSPPPPAGTTPCTSDAQCTLPEQCCPVKEICEVPVSTNPLACGEYISMSAVCCTAVLFFCMHVQDDIVDGGQPEDRHTRIVAGRVTV